MWIKAKIEREQIHRVVLCMLCKYAYLSMVTRYFKSSLLINLTFERSQMRVRVIDLQTVHITSENKQASKSLRNKTPFESPSNLFLSTFLSFVVYSVQSNLSLSLFLFPLSTHYTRQRYCSVRYIYAVLYHQ